MTTAKLSASRALATPEAEGDRRLLGALRRGDEEAFAEIVDAWGASMIRASLTWVSSVAVAEEVVQETWLRMLNALDRFEGRSSLRTWVFAILANCARKRARREGRSIPFASLARAESTRAEPAADPDDFFPADHARWPGAWSTVVDGFAAVPEDRLLSAEMRELVRRAIDALPPVQRAVMALRDVEGWSAEEACAFLDLSESNQRVLLHRARASVRRRMRSYLEEDRAD